MKFVVSLVIIVITFVILAGSYAKTEPLSLEDHNMDIVRLSIHAFNDGDWSSFADLYSPRYLQHAPGREDPLTWSDYELSCRIAHRRLPSFKYLIEDIFAVKNKVVIRVIWEFPGGRSFVKRSCPDGVKRGSEISIFRIDEGKIVEEWCEYDPENINELIRYSSRLEHMK